MWFDERSPDYQVDQITGSVRSFVTAETCRAWRPRNMQLTTLKWTIRSVSNHRLTPPAAICKSLP